MCYMELESFAVYGNSVFSEPVFELGFGQSVLTFKGDITFDGLTSLPTNILISEHSLLNLGRSFTTEKGLNITNYGTFVSNTNFPLSYIYN